MTITKPSKPLTTAEIRELHELWKRTQTLGLGEMCSMYRAFSGIRRKQRQRS